MGLFDQPEDAHEDAKTEKNEEQKQHLMISMPGGEGFVPLGRSQIKRKYEDEIGPRLVIILDEVAELLMPTKVKTEAGKQEDALKQEITSLIMSITQLGRSAGIHIILCPLRLSTLIPTTKGYKTMGSISLGDIVFDANNCPTEVISLAPIKQSESMYEISYLDLDDNLHVIGSDGDHRFPVSINDELPIVIRTDELYKKFNKEISNSFFLSTNNTTRRKIVCIERIENEPVRCIEVDSPTHMFLIAENEEEDWVKNPSEDSYRYGGIVTHNTQRNDTSIIPGVVQSNPLALNTKLKVRRPKTRSNCSDFS